MCDGIENGTTQHGACDVAAMHPPPLQFHQKSWHPLYFQCHPRGTTTIGPDPTHPQLFAKTCSGGGGVVGRLGVGVYWQLGRGGGKGGGGGLGGSHARTGPSPPPPPPGMQLSCGGIVFWQHSFDLELCTRFAFRLLPGAATTNFLWWVVGGNFQAISDSSRPPPPPPPKKNHRALPSSSNACGKYTAEPFSLKCFIRCERCHEIAQLYQGCPTNACLGGGSRALACALNMSQPCPKSTPSLNNPIWFPFPWHMLPNKEVLRSNLGGHKHQR